METKSIKQKCFKIFKISAITLTTMRGGDLSIVGLKTSTLGN